MIDIVVQATFALNVALLLMLIVIAVAIARMRKLLAAILLMGVYSLVSATWLVVMDAPDVAFTEAVVGAGISTIVLLGAILLVRVGPVRHDWRTSIVPAVLVVAVGGLLVYAVAALPEFGDPASPTLVRDLKDPHALFVLMPLRV